MSVLNINLRASVLGRKRVSAFLVAVAIAITVVGFAADVHSTLSYPGSDLRNRVVGARLMLEGIDPYLFKWQPGLSERFYDPLDNPSELVSKLSVPPTVLTLHGAIAPLSYLHQKIIWLLVQWGALAGTVWIFIRTSAFEKTPWILAVGFCFASSLFWRFHVSSGQIYIVYAFVLAIAWFFLQQKSRYRCVISGFLAGVAASLRPSFILFSIPFIVQKQYVFLLGGVSGFCSSLAVSYWVVGGFIWKRYILTILQMTGLVDLAAYLSLDEGTLPSLNTVYPKIVEGFDWNVSYPLEHYFADTSFYLPLNVLRVPNERGILILGLMVTLVYLSVLIAKSLPESKKTNHAFLIGVLICLLGDFFLPIPRFSYYDVQMILPLLLLVSQSDVDYLMSHWSRFVLLLGFFLGMVGFVAIPKALFFGGLAIGFYVTVMSVRLVKRSHAEMLHAIDS